MYAIVFYITFPPKLLVKTYHDSPESIIRKANVSIPDTGTSRERGLLLFVIDWLISTDEVASNGSISQGETLSGLLMVVGSSH